MVLLQGGEVTWLHVAGELTNSALFDQGWKMIRFRYGKVRNDRVEMSPSADGLSGEKRGLRGSVKRFRHLKIARVAFGEAMLQSGQIAEGGVVSK
jgi:hypothetical protein